MSVQALNSNILDKLINHLEQANFYPHKPEQVEHIQTHISHVFIAPPYVYKFKKPVDFGFLDYSTLKKRKKYCRREVNLNRRLSDDIYLGIISIVEQNGAVEFVEEELSVGNVVEYAVKMRLLPEEYFLHTYLEDGSLTYDQLNRLANKLAEFYDGQDPDEEVLRWGKIENIKVNTDENFEQTKAFIGETIEQNSFDAIRHFTNEYFNQHQSLFEQRVQDKRIVDGHGDLHLEHIHITPDKVQIYDCIEFNERFRYGDLAVDLAFLAMDLDFNNRWKEERYFIDRMAKILEDPGLLSIIDFYKCYRAYVKGKVKSLQSGEEEVPKQERKKAAATAARYFKLSLRYALLGSHPKLLVVMGRVGTGKSTIARHLSHKLDIERFSSDRIRKKMAGLPLSERSPEEKRDELYSRQMSEKTYQALLDHAVECLGDGRSVILDATYSKRSARKKLIETVEVPVLFVETEAPDAVIKERLQARDGQEDVVSDARREDFEALASTFEAPREIPREYMLKVSTDCSVSTSRERLYKKLADINIQHG
ncbi:AAA family ATPase [Fodinibius saliphilus]|uniref:bifunctional aminoglycoside phosphotransferase/ATP-binding protein n=1 Tax=Fodinibius saliphilus TaxID=1920650 RepID=UPI001107C177|nr:bifunctional aminoglycoside phosphotransferase/ATP-binding protein [Fodinibius saliphilus]